MRSWWNQEYTDTARPVRVAREGTTGAGHHAGTINNAHTHTYAKRGHHNRRMAGSTALAQRIAMAGPHAGVPVTRAPARGGHLGAELVPGGPTRDHHAQRLVPNGWPVALSAVARGSTTEHTPTHDVTGQPTLPADRGAPALTVDAGVVAIRQVHGVHVATLCAGQAPGLALVLREHPGGTAGGPPARAGR
jgi:hypothetical protein